MTVATTITPTYPTTTATAAAATATTTTTTAAAAAAAAAAATTRNARSGIAACTNSLLYSSSERNICKSGMSGTLGPSHKSGAQDRQSMFGYESQVPHVKTAPL